MNAVPGKEKKHISSSCDEVEGGEKASRGIKNTRCDLGQVNLLLANMLPNALKCPRIALHNINARMDHEINEEVVGSARGQD